MADSPIDKYLRTGSLEQSSWHSVVLFGKNTVSYKFALAQSLMQLAQQGRDSVTLDELAVPFAARICEHAKTAPRQSTNRSNKFLDACLGFNAGTVTLDELTSVTVQSGFRYVLDAFHVVNAGRVPMTFFEKDFTRSSKRLILTDNLNLPRFHCHLLRRLRAAIFRRPIGLLELRRAEVAQRRVDPGPVVDDLDVLEQIQRGLLARGVGARVHAFRLHDAHERLHGRVVPRRGYRAH